MRGIFRKKNGTTVEIAVIFMLITLALGVVVLSYSISMSRTAANYDKVTSGKRAVDAIASSFLRDPEKFDASVYGDEYTFVIRAEEGVLDVYRSDKLIECSEAFIADPIYFQFNYDYSSLGGYSVFVVWDEGAPSLEIYYINSTQCILKIYTDRAYDANGDPLYSKEAGYYLYRPVSAARHVTVASGEEETQRVWEREDYSFSYMRSFYRANGTGLIFIEVKDGAFVKYEYGAN